MIVLAFFSWWYGHGWYGAVTSLTKRVDKVNRVFSVGLLTRTLFSPWRRIISSPGATISDHMRAWGDNLVSRVIGFIVRLFVLLGALLSIIAITVLSIVELIVWPLLPPAILACLILGVIR